MTQHTLSSITRRTRNAVSAARKRFADYRTGDGHAMLLAALRRLEGVEDDVRFLDDVDAGYAVVSQARQTIREAFEATELEARARNEAMSDYLSSLERERSRAAFSGRLNFNLAQMH